MGRLGKFATTLILLGLAIGAIYWLFTNDKVREWYKTQWRKLTHPIASVIDKFMEETGIGPSDPERRRQVAEALADAVLAPALLFFVSPLSAVIGLVAAVANAGSIWATGHGLGGDGDGVLRLQMKYDPNEPSSGGGGGGWGDPTDPATKNTIAWVTQPELTIPRA
jgi:hypothetical protein